MSPEKSALVINHLMGKVPAHKMPDILEILESHGDESLAALLSINMVSPTSVLVMSLFFGPLAIDRFMIGQWGLAILKILLCVCVVGALWVVIDWFTIMSATRDANFNAIRPILNAYELEN